MLLPTFSIKLRNVPLSKDDDGKMVKWLHSQMKLLYSATKSIVL